MLGQFSHIRFPIRTPKETLLFLLGLVSTWQIVQVAGFSLSTWLTVLTAAYLVLTGKLSFRKDWLLLSTMLCCCITFVVAMVSGLPAGYKRNGITGFLQWILMLLVVFSVRREPTEHATDSFFRGFDWSCKIHLAWCVLQMGAFYVLGLDINTLIFRQLLNVQQDIGLMKDGVLVCTGLHWHTANLTPVLLYAFFRYRSLFVKGLCLILVYFTKSATGLIAFGIAFGLELMLFVKRTLCDRQCSLRRRLAAQLLLVLCALAVVAPLVIPKLRQALEYLLLRLSQIQNPTEGNESSAVHFNYYLFAPKILPTLPLHEALFGSGIATSGYRYTVFYYQYPDLIWSVESDFINILFSQGILGVLLHYTLLAKIAWLSIKQRQGHLACLVLALVLSGIFYDNQFLWVVLMEWMLYCRLHNTQAAPRLRKV